MQKNDPMSAKKQVEGYLIDKATEYIIPRAKGLAAHLGVEGKFRKLNCEKLNLSGDIAHQRAWFNLIG